MWSSHADYRPVQDVTESKLSSEIPSCDAVLSIDDQKDPTPRKISFLQLGIVIWAVVATIFSIKISYQNYTERSRNSPQTLNPWGLVPEFKSTLVTFNRDEKFYNYSDPNSQTVWQELGHIGLQGWIILNEPRKYPWLERGIPMSRGREKFVFSAFHGLHCLALIRQGYTALITGNSSAVISNDHSDHCFDYLRQKTMCSADMTMEWADYEVVDSPFELDGWGVTHQCRRWDDAMEFVMSTPGHEKKDHTHS